MWLGLVSAAFAGASMSGISVPTPGGGWTTATADGALGVLVNPAAAAASDFDLAIDAAALQAKYSYQLEGADPNGGDWGTSVVPTLMATMPLGERFGLGFTVHAPYARGGSGQDPEGPQRFHSIRGNFLVLEEAVVMAAQVTSGLSVGLQGRLVQMTQSSEKSIDAGALISNVTGEDLPVGDPFLEGRQALIDFGALSASWGVGARARNAAGFGVDAWFRPSIEMPLAGTVEVQPSRDLNLVLELEAEADFTLPMQVGVAGRVPLGRVVIIPELEYWGWQASGRVPNRLGDVSITSPDPVMSGILSDFGLDEATFIDGTLPDSNADTRWRNIIVPSLAAEWAITERWTGRGAALYGPAAVTDDFVHPGNLDFATINLRAGLGYRPMPWATVLSSFDHYLPQSRTITDSPLSLEDPVERGPLVPSGNGSYELGLWRFGVTLVLHGKRV